MAKYFFVLCGYNMIDISNNRMVTPNTIVLTPNVGIRKNPAKKVPTILPIVDKEDILPDKVPISFSSLLFIFTANGDTVGIRMPDSLIAKTLIDYSEVPIATPSANISGKPSGTSIANIMKDFKDSVDCIIDNGESKLGIASTIVKVENEKPIILREGAIKKEEIFDFVNNYNKRKD